MSGHNGDVLEIVTGTGTILLLGPSDKQGEVELDEMLFLPAPGRYLHSARNLRSAPPATFSVRIDAPLHHRQLLCIP